MGYALAMIGSTIRNANISPIERTAMDELLSKLCDDVGACERIFKTPIPRVYTSHLSRFVGSWLFFLPLALYSINMGWNHLIDPIASFLITFFLIGIEELGQQIEEPFSILPLEAYCDGSIGAPIHAMVLAEDMARKRKKLSADGLADVVVKSEASTDGAEMGETQGTNLAGDEATLQTGDMKGVVVKTQASAEQEASSGHWLKN